MATRIRHIGVAALAGAGGLVAVLLATRRIRELSGFTSADGARRYLDAYDEVLHLWPVAYQERDVPTPFGDTHIITSGPEAGPPLVLLHATGTSSTGWLLNVGELSRIHRVYAVDIVGEAGKSRQTRLLRDRGDCVEWLSAVLDGLGLDRCGWPGGRSAAG